MSSNQKLIDSIVESAKKIVDRERKKDRERLARRDQHAKHHGCVWAYLDVLESAPSSLKVGLFANKARYRAWVRFSNSASYVRNDAKLDGRGVAIKLLLDDAKPHPQTQDFILLNHSAFFAENLKEMASIFRWLGAGVPLPLYFLAHPWRWRGAWAIYKLATRPNSVLDLTYFSQLPSALGIETNLSVKYRLSPIAGVEPTRPSKVEKASGNHLRHTLRSQLRPNQRDRADAINGHEREPKDAPGDVLFAFEVQKRKDGERDDVANVSWQGDFEQVAVLRIPRQDFEHPDRMTFAENMAFNVWNTLKEHEPRGDLSEARNEVYKKISAYRRKRNDDRPEPAYTLEQWRKLRALPASPAVDPALKDVIAALSPAYARWLEKLFTGRFAFALPSAVLVIALVGLFVFPQYMVRPFMIDAPLRLLGAVMKSEQLIPKAIPSPEYRQELSATGNYRPAQDSDDPEWQFRYGEMGSEFSAGIPYWVYRVLPKVASKHFTGWSDFGLVADDDQKYYTDYHGLPRGLILSDSLVTIGNRDYGIPLKRVTLNCASCHRGEVRVGEEKRFLNGMPNLNFDAASYKRKLSEAIASDDFTYPRVIDAIDRALAEEHEKQKRAGKPHQLSFYEKLVYGYVVRLMKQDALAKQKKLVWMKRRPDNGPGRLDAFGAFRHEVLGLPDAPSGTPQEKLLMATVDLPSVWNQGADYRLSHHYDGNTKDSRARNIGAIIGVGGDPLSVRFRNVKRVADWLDDGLEAPKYPWRHEIDAEAVQRGKEVYEKKCSGCHGSYDGNNRLSAPTDCMERATSDLAKTDPQRRLAVDDFLVEKLNELGRDKGIWEINSFEATQAYLCPPLDGIWARAPYLHNGSVPTLEHLLSGERVETFIRGNPEYDRDHGGFVYTKGDPTRLSFEFDTRKPGNSARGHDSERQLVKDGAERHALIQYLYQL